MRSLGVLGFLSAVAVCAAMAGAATINVGPSRTYTTVQAGVTAASPGDTVLIDGVTLSGDAAAATIATDNLTIKGSAGTVLNFTGSTGGVGLNASAAVTTVVFDSLEAKGTTGANACIVSNATGTTTVNNCKLHDTGMGFNFFAGNATITNSHVYNCTSAGTIFNRSQAGVNAFTMKGCWVHNGNGHYTFRIYSKNNYIMYNRLGDEVGWTNPGATNEGQIMDFPSGGLTYVIGNVFGDTANASSGRDRIYYLTGTLGAGYSSQIYLVYNTIALRRAASDTFLYCPTATVPAYVADNVCTHDGGGTLVNGNVVNNSAMINSNIQLYLHQGSNPLGVHRLMYDANGYDGDGNYASVATPPVYDTWDVLNVRPVDPNTFPFGAGCSNTSTKMPLPNGYQTVLSPGAGVALLVPGSNPLALPATGEDGTSLTPTMQYSNMPQAAGVAGGTQVRLNATDAIGAYALVPPPSNPPVGPITSMMPPFIYEGWTVNMTATATGGTPPYTYQWTQTGGQTQTLTAPTALNTSFTVPFKSLTSVANENLAFQFQVTDSVSQHSDPASTSVTCYMCGDVDHDQAVILADLKLLVAAWNSTPASGNWNAWADLDGDNAIILADLKLLVANWNRSVH